jgi:hypothetical protein
MAARNSHSLAEASLRLRVIRIAQAEQDLAPAAMQLSLEPTLSSLFDAFESVGKKRQRFHRSSGSRICRPKHA